MKILISAAETSSDAHAAELLHALRAETREKIEAFGIGGPKLLAQGQRQIVDARELLSMGFVEIIGRLPKIFSALKAIEREAIREKPDVAVFVDYPDFHFRLARRLARLKIPLVYYIPPKVWVWRKGRIHFLKKYFARILCILPFEEDFYRQSSVPVCYVGNPLQDELPLNATREEARSKLGLSQADHVLAILVGSRPTELKRHLEVFMDGALKTAVKLAQRGVLKDSQKLQLLLPFAATSELDGLRAQVTRLAESLKARHGENAQIPIEIRISQGDSAWVMRAANVGLIKSGTSTLEAALLDLPHLIAYRPNEFTCFIVKKVIGYNGPIGLSNLVAGAKLQPYPITELNCSAVTAESIASELDLLFDDRGQESERSKSVKATLKKIQSVVLKGGESPSRVAAREVLAVIAENAGGR
jgi:lipid-A-disaccharide synthase